MTDDSRSNDSRSGEPTLPRPSPPGHRLTAWLVGIAISLVFFALAVRGVDWPALRDAVVALDSARAGSLAALAALLSIAHLWLRAARWRLLVEPLTADSTTPISTHRLFVVSWIGAALDNLLPARAGDVARAALLRRDGVSGSAAFGTIIVERLIDVLATQLLLVAAMLVAPLPPWLLGAGAATLAIALFVFAGIALALSQSDRLRGLTVPLPERFQRYGISSASAFLAGLRAALRFERAPTLVAWSLAIHAANLGAVACMLVACGVGGANEVELAVRAVTILTFVSFAIMLPAAPGQMGTLHFACVAALSLAGVAATPALAFALLYHATQYLPVTAGMLLFSGER
ncbi:MAG: lysylphosphatidylglycerol synthase transmembrane domain-containing protein [Acidobacteriota bacterium]